MKTIISYIAFFIVLLSITACNKVIDLKLDNEDGKLVIEGNITNVPGPQVIKLSSNVSFSSTNTYPPVTGVQVSVSDQNGNNYTFKEAPAGTYTASQLTSVAGNTYTMTVVSNSKTYKASSVMPNFVALDSVVSAKNDFDSKNNKKKITVYYQDQAGIANQYRFVMYVNGVQVKSVFANDDEFTDGNHVSYDLNQDDIDIYPGDKVTVEMQCIDKPVYTYWFTLMQQGFNGPGGSVTPSNPPNNITPTVLGYFSAHTTQTVTITVKP
ncbi:DUF4249 domain-containing protein [Mucilaginibacter polytrichastri]|uniref:DUF4249 domain-containing protein n=1 Tax=Mucilaginibacter polytrichastri TaxID=1302689 RepID=A0A1Q5ZVH7_9SPHI|nr:DUF4249 domain-containing protein [Mucilaginibacter polytrichastri]OKS85772.1 hypothetical protein RG47T_1218 [Mucilaginibacter polytrichastri]SFS61591.1 protein of unknown function [Mucilaginibacter polytrichastri]